LTLKSKKPKESDALTGDVHSTRIWITVANGSLTVWSIHHLLSISYHRLTPGSFVGKIASLGGSVKSFVILEEWFWIF